MGKISVQTSKKREIIDITDLVNREISAAGFKEGICNFSGV
jgi:thiamine phosphate synthase YjbQ (UPF0047 family)